MLANPFRAFLKGLGFRDSEIGKEASNNIFTYRSIKSDVVKNFPSDSFDVKYIYFDDKVNIYETHFKEWNKNQLNSFIAVTGSTSYFINVKEKPRETREDYLSWIGSQTKFNFGTETVDFLKENQTLNEISREKIDSGFFFDFILSRIKPISPVDKDLLLNLIALKNNLLNKTNEKDIHVLILRCLFLKYLEDRGIIDDNKKLSVILETESPEKLISSFKEIKKINGDLFNRDDLNADKIKEKHLVELKKFFSSYDYKTGQGSLFPYQFDKIPIQLISNIYESFLKTEERKGKGIYYTPSLVVDFMLSQTLSDKLKKSTNATVLDPACGSGAYLVRAFEMIVEKQKAQTKFELKKKILKEQIFGIDIDPDSLLIAAFSLYLALLENEKPEKIKDKIKKQHPILPTLIGKTLIEANALLNDNRLRFDTEALFSEQFDCVVANPPWGSISDDEKEENKKTRGAIGNKAKPGTMPEYKNVSDYQRSQAFLLRMHKWSHPKTSLSLIVNNSIFLNDNAQSFREELLQIYAIDTFYELSGINKILFKKKTLGEDNKGNKIEIGANEPCCVLMMSAKAPATENKVKYISPKLSRYSEAFNFIHFTQKDIKEVRQGDFIEEDMLWRVFVNGDWEGYQLLRKRVLNMNSALSIECRSGFMPQKNMKPTGKPLYIDWIKQDDFKQYFITNAFSKFNWNQSLHRARKEDIFKGKRILIPVRPLSSDQYQLRGILVKDFIVHTDQILSIKIKRSNEYITDYNPYLGIFNSSLIGYFFYQQSAQWGKGEEKRPKIRNKDVESLPLPSFEKHGNEMRRLNKLVNDISNSDHRNIQKINVIKKEIDDLVFDLYGLLDFEKEIIREFYQINVERANDSVRQNDLQKYLDKFREVFSFILDDSLVINATCSISSNIGTAICFSIVSKDKFTKGIITESFDVLHIIKKNQIEKTYFSNMLNEEKVRIYTPPENFYIIKSNFFKDWTVRQAMKDANEEVGIVLKNLPQEA